MLAEVHRQEASMMAVRRSYYLMPVDLSSDTCKSESTKDRQKQQQQKQKTRKLLAFRNNRCGVCVSLSKYSLYQYIFLAKGKLIVLTTSMYRRRLQRHITTASAYIQ